MSDYITPPKALSKASSDKPQPGTEEWYRANSDARTLVDAERIRADQKRLTAANYILQSEREATLKAAAAANRAAKRG